MEARLKRDGEQHGGNEARGQGMLGKAAAGRRTGAGREAQTVRAWGPWGRKRVQGQREDGLRGALHSRDAQGGHSGETGQGGKDALPWRGRTIPVPARQCLRK